MDVQNLNGVQKLKRFCRSCIELIINFCLNKFYFQLMFFYYFDFQEHKIYLKASLSKVCLLEIILWPFIFVVIKFELCNFFSC